MQPLDDSVLLRQYAENRSDEAFTALVTRHINLVYSVALRQAGNPHHAEEITQAVFIILARKAAQLRHDRALASWLFQTTRLTANNFLRGEIRRRRREQEAYMQSSLNETANEAWPRIAALLDPAVEALVEKDRRAIVLRFYEGHNLRDVGQALGTSEAAAEKRVSRALEKLRKFFTKRGVVLSAVAFAGTMSANAVQAAPVGLAATVTATATKGTALSAAMAALVKGTMNMLTWMKLKFALGVGTALVLAGGALTVGISQSTAGNKLTAEEIADQLQAAYAVLSSYSDTGKVTTEVSGQTLESTFTIRLQRPNRYRIEWAVPTQSSAALVTPGVVWSAGDGDFFMITASGRAQNTKPVKYQDMQTALAAATDVSGAVTAIIPQAFFNQDWNSMLKIPASGRPSRTRERDEKIRGVDCFVISGRIDLSKSPDKSKFPVNLEGLGLVTTTLWIGKQDHLIHQTRQIMDYTIKPEMINAQIKTMLERMNQPATPEVIAAARAGLEKMMPSGRAQKILITQKHENISINQKFSSSDFTH
jgi:RNA polymerase sigma factor (sigma-70 family)